MRLLLIEDEEKTSTYMSGFIASTPPGQEVMPIMGTLVNGVIARKVGVITPGNTPQLTSLVFNFAMPAIILSGITTEQPHISGKDLSIVLTSAFTTLILLIICSRMLARILRYEREYYGVITVMTTFTNVSMMGIPMIYSLYGSEAMIYITVFLLPYNLLFFSYGYYCMKDQSGNTESLNTIYLPGK